MTLKVGIIGLGSMGNTHLDVYTKLDDVEVIAVSDKRPERLSGKAKARGNIEGQAQGSFRGNFRGFTLDNVRRYPEGMELIADPDVELVDICLPTPLHAEYFQAATEAGKHVLVEKPVARTYEQAAQMIAANDKAQGITMPAMCMRFWPGWTWLKRAIDERPYGRVLSASFRRVANHPGGEFYLNADQCGGALLDLHIHDTDFIRYCFGEPKAVSSLGYAHVTPGIDHVLTHYHYDHIPIVTAEGGWAMSAGFGFQMQYTVNFEHATAEFDLARDPALRLSEPGQAPRGVELDPAMGYHHEIRYLLDCIRDNRRPTIVTIQDAAEALRIVEAELESITTGAPVFLTPSQPALR